jgi:hypothetical protein
MAEVEIFIYPPKKKDIFEIGWGCPKTLGVR